MVEIRAIISNWKWQIKRHNTGIGVTIDQSKRESSKQNKNSSKRLHLSAKLTLTLTNIKTWAKNLSKRSQNSVNYRSNGRRTSGRKV